MLHTLKTSDTGWVGELNDGGRVLHATIWKGAGVALALWIFFVAVAAVFLLFGGEALAQEAHGSGISSPEGSESEQDLAPVPETSSIPTAPSESPEPVTEPVVEPVPTTEPAP